MEANDVTNKILEAIAEDNDRVGQKVFHGLLESVPVNNLPEQIFKNYFLPNFLGLSQVPNQQWMLEWVSIAGTPMSEVCIIDDVTGQPLFMVPPILNSNGLIMNKTEGDLGDIFTRYDQISKNTPSSGLGFLITALNTKNEEFLSNLNNNEVLGRWIAIMQRYGYNPTTEAITQEQTTQNKLDDYFDI